MKTMNDQQILELQQRIMALESVLVYVRNFLPLPLKAQCDQVLWPQSQQPLQ